MTGKKEAQSLRCLEAHRLITQGRLIEAWPVVSEALNEDSEDPVALYLCGVLLRDQKHNGMALQMFRRALAFESKNVNLWMHYAATLHDLHYNEEAREAFDVIAKSIPQDPMPIANIAATYIQQGRAREAVEWADKALAMDAYPAVERIAHISRGFGNLMLRRWREGWKSAKWLYEETIVTRIYRGRDNPEPEWDGSPGQTVVVQGEQGIGDQIMFAQCLPEMARDCKKVIVDCNPRLETLFKRSFPECDIYGTMKSTQFDWPQKYEIDARTHISYLGKFYRNEDAEFTRKAYLKPDPKLQEEWRQFLAPYPRPWVGVAWLGGAPATNNRRRSLRLGDLAPLLNQDGTFVSLCYQNVGREVAEWNIRNRQQVLVPVIDNENIDEIVALVSVLDHVVSVTTTVAHVCGALGRKAQVLVPNVPAWRYGMSGDDMIWYPENSVRLYRQANGEQDFEHAIARLVRDYQAFIAPMVKAA